MTRAALFAAAVLLGTAGGATAAGPRITVTPATGLDAAGDTVHVTGEGFDPEKGIYVAFCVDRGPAEKPTPCGGGADTTGTGGGSRWIANDPPPYGRGLAIPYGAGGTFAVDLAVSATIGDYDCRKVRCAVVTRADHTRPEDRTQDTRLAVSFAKPGSNTAAVAGAGAAAVVVGAAGAAGVVALGRRRKTGGTP